MEVNETVNKAWELAKKVQTNAHAPYSHFQVGAALKLKNSEHIITGCNVENASFGATVCAERGAIQTSIAQFGKHAFEFIVVVSNTEPAIGPCALCLQVLCEFATSDMPIYFSNRNAIQKVVTFGDLLPQPFAEIPDTI